MLLWRSCTVHLLVLLLSVAIAAGQDAVQVPEADVLDVGSDEPDKAALRLVELEAAVTEREATIAILKEELRASKENEASLASRHASHAKELSQAQGAAEAARAEKAAALEAAGAEKAAALEAARVEKATAAAEAKRLKEEAAQMRKQEKQLLAQLATAQKSLEAAQAQLSRSASKKPSINQVWADSVLLAEAAKDDAAAWAKKMYAAAEEKVTPVLKACEPAVAAAAAAAAKAKTVAVPVLAAAWNKTAPARAQAWETCGPTVEAAQEQLAAAKAAAMEAWVPVEASAKKAAADACEAHDAAYEAARVQLGDKATLVGYRALVAFVALLLLRVFGSTVLYLVLGVIRLAMYLLLLPFRIVWSVVTLPFGWRRKKSAAKGAAAPAKATTGTRPNRPNPVAVPGTGGKAGRGKGNKGKVD